MVGRENDRGPGESNVRRCVCISSSGGVLDRSSWASGMDTFDSTVQTDNLLPSINNPTSSMENDFRKTERACLGGIILVGYANMPVDAMLFPNFRGSSSEVSLDSTINPLPMSETMNHCWCLLTGEKLNM